MAWNCNTSSRAAGVTFTLLVLSLFLLLFVRGTTTNKKISSLAPLFSMRTRWSYQKCAVTGYVPATGTRKRLPCVWSWEVCEAGLSPPAFLILSKKFSRTLLDTATFASMVSEIYPVSVRPILPGSLNVDAHVPALHLNFFPILSPARRCIWRSARLAPSCPSQFLAYYTAILGQKWAPTRSSNLSLHYSISRWNSQLVYYPLLISVLETLMLMPT